MIVVVTHVLIALMVFVMSIDDDVILVVVVLIWMVLTVMDMVASRC